MDLAASCRAWPPAAGRGLGVRLEQVDGNGVLPLRAADRAFPTAAAFRRHLQRTVPPFLAELPAAAPLAAVPRGVRNASRGRAHRAPRSPR